MSVYVSDLEREDLPHVVGSYLLVDVLGVGGMGAVFRARSMNSRGEMKEHALKVLRDDVDTETRRAMFLREARIGRLLRHENLVRTDDFFVEGEERFLVLELVEGPDLHRLIKGRKQPLAPPEAADLVAQACAGLHAAHNVRDGSGRVYGLVHRDLKPANLIVRKDGVLKVADFGIAKPTRIPMTDYVTAEADQSPRGTLTYMSPEQLRSEQLDRRSDLWAMGAILYYALTGRHLFGSHEGLAVLMGILRMDFGAEARPFERVDRLLPGAGSVLKKCITQDPADRFSDAQELANALTFLADESAARKTLAFISAQNLPDWMAVPGDDLQDPRKTRGMPLVESRPRGRIREEAESSRSVGPIERSPTKPAPPPRMLERAPARPEPPPADVEEALPDWLTSDEVEPEPEQKPEPEGRSDAAVLARRDRIAWLALAAIGGLMLLMVAVALVVLMTSG